MPKFFSLIHLDEVLPSALVSYFGDKGLFGPVQDCFTHERKDHKILMSVTASCGHGQEAHDMGSGNGGVIVSNFIDKG